MKKKKKMMTAVDHSARRQMRAEQISNGTWMGRNVVHRSAVDYKTRSVAECPIHRNYVPHG